MCPALPAEHQASPRLGKFLQLSCGELVQLSAQSPTCLFTTHRVLLHFSQRASRFHRDERVDGSIGAERRKFRIRCVIENPMTCDWRECPHESAVWTPWISAHFFFFPVGVLSQNELNMFLKPSVWR